MMDFNEIRQYWDQRAGGDSSVQSTTQDIYLREIEFEAVLAQIQKYAPARVADVGSGDGRTTVRLASRVAAANFTGFDYADSMVDNARKIHAHGDGARVRFDSLDICEGLTESFDLIYTTRCLINLPSWELQMQALHNIHAALPAGGTYVMVENFVEGQNNFNQLRRQYGLNEIPVRVHNKFFERSRLMEFADPLFSLAYEANISSTYYLMSRVIYARICRDAGVEPDYFDDHHKLAAGLPFCGEFGPVRLVCFKKR